MTIADARVSKAAVEATHPPHRRSPGKTPEAMTALAGRIRALQRSEPRANGAERTQALAELNAAQLRLERLSLATWRNDTNRASLLADTFALAQDVDRLAKLWPPDAIANLAIATAHRPRHRTQHDRKAA